MKGSRVHFRTDSDVSSHSEADASVINRKQRRSLDFGADRSPEASSLDNDALYKKLKTIRDLVYDMPELETSILASGDCSKSENKIKLPRWLLELSGSLIHFLFVCALIFLIGFIVGALMSCPTGLAGTRIRRFTGSGANDLYLVKAVIEPGGIRLLGSLQLEFDVYNCTPFTATLDAFMTVDYLSKEPDGVTGTFLNASTPTAADCYSSYGFRTQINPFPDAVKNKVLHFTYSNEHGAIKSINSMHGNLIALQGARPDKSNKQVPFFNVLDAWIYDAFKSRTLVANAIEGVQNIASGLNHISLLVTINHFINDDDDAGGLTADVIKRECASGYITLRCTTRDLRFNTMIFGSDLTPVKFMPIQVPCSTLDSATASSDPTYHKLLRVIKQNLESVYNSNKVMRRLDLISRNT